MTTEMTPVLHDDLSTPRATRRRVRVAGAVQGVGFRPFVYRLAHRLSLGGRAWNDARGVVIEIEGLPAAVDQFVDRLVADAPPLSVIDEVTVDAIDAVGEATFTIADSALHGTTTARVSPDVAPCTACLAELFDPNDRRYRYPFINCTDCGPRLTIVRGVPYDRVRTTMSSFTMCARCQREYEDPVDRRFHAQPNACADCGPSVRLVDGRDVASALAGSVDAVGVAARWLADGAIVAVKGLGGFHLACRADDEAVVRRLRGRKHREDKPFAIMVSDLDAARALIEVDEPVASLLTSRERPIVLAPRRSGARIADAVAPRHRDLGVMLPSTPLHHLLLSDVGVPLVMTSGNRSSEPIAYRDDDARARLDSIADIFLVHDRPIETRVDDSVVRVVTIADERRPLVLRRSRGAVPTPIALPIACDIPTLGAGAQLKNTFTLASGTQAWVGHHIGDLDDVASRHAYRDGIDHFSRLLSIEPQRVAHDLHPDYHSTHYAQDQVTMEAVGVQHHHAHLAALLAEHGETGPAVGVICDGTGYGTDGTVWGGEILVGDLASVTRVGHLWPVPMPGGEAAIDEPWRMACAWLLASGDEGTTMPAPLRTHVDQREWTLVGRLARNGLASPMTTSAGRLLDAVAAICGIRPRITYEGQAAIELEMRAAECRDPVEPYPCPVHPGVDGLILDARPLIRAVVADLGAGVAVPEIALRAHRGLGRATISAACETAARHRMMTVGLSGGVFQNVLLLEFVATALTRAGLRVLVPRRLPPNDGGVSYGQVAVSAARAVHGGLGGRRNSMSGE